MEENEDLPASQYTDIRLMWWWIHKKDLSWEVMSPLLMLPIPRNSRNSLQTSPFLIHLPSVLIRDMQAGRTAAFLLNIDMKTGSCTRQSGENLLLSSSLS
jgi:hypothetical protein